MSRFTLRAALAAFILFASTAATPAFSLALTGNTTYSGRAFAAYVQSSLCGVGPIVISDTGELPPSGGAKGCSLLSVNVPGNVLCGIPTLLRADVMVASTSGASGKARSSASLANAVLLPGTAAQITASFVRSESEATCLGVRGSSELASLKFCGVDIAVSGCPNQRVVLPCALGNVTIVINEQVQTHSGNYHEIRVNALHVTIPGVAEIILSSAKSDINCAVTQPGPCHDFVTGGGWILGPSGEKANFGFNAGLKADGTKMDIHLVFHDHGANLKVKATSLTAYERHPQYPNTGRRMWGTCEINGRPGYTFMLDVRDNGEPGKDVDFFYLHLSTGYVAQGYLKGGNIQLHKGCN